MDIDTATIDEIKKQVLAEITKEYILVHKPKASGCGCSGHKILLKAKTEGSRKPSDDKKASTVQATTEVLPVKDDDSPDQTSEDNAVQSPESENRVIREAWKVDDDIYEPIQNQVPPPEIKDIELSVFLQLVLDIEEIYQVAKSCENLEEYCKDIQTTMNANATAANSNFTAINGVLPSAPYPKSQYPQATEILIEPLKPTPRFIKERHISQGPSHYTIGNEIPES